MSPTESETHPQHPLIPRLRSHLHALPPEFRHALRVTLRAFALGWTISSIGSVLGLLVKVLASRTRRPVVSRILADILRVLQFSVTRNGMPWLFAGVFGGYKFVDEVMRRRDVRQRSSEKFPASSPSKDSDDATAPRRAFLATLLAAYLSLLLVHRRFPRTPTVDLTLFAIVRAMDVGAHIAYHSDRVRGVVPAWTLEHADVVVFAVASAEIMFAFFYEPDRLPKTYVRWIAEMAAMEPRLLTVIRLLRSGEMRYGVDTGHNGIMGAYCIELGLPERLADMRRRRLPCVILHSGKTDGCEAHAIRKWVSGFWKALKIYLPVHLLPPLLFRRHRLLSTPFSSLLHALLASFRSSAFLATFIALAWYSVCLVRTRIGYQVLRLPQQRLDKISGPLLGCLLCGLSLLIENKHRRGEMALFVAPRALYAVWERVVVGSGYKMEGAVWAAAKEAGECGIFAVAAATVVRAMVNGRENVRPAVRGLLAWILD